MSGTGPAFGRRTFLASGVGLSAGVVAAGTLDTPAAEGTVAAPRRVRRMADANATPGSLRAGSLTVNGLVDPVASIPTTARSPGRCPAVAAGWCRPATGSW